MERLKNAIEKTLQKESSINWLILHSLSSFYNNTSHTKIELGESSRKSEHFEKPLGYLTLNKKTTTKTITDTVQYLIRKFDNNTIALSNLFIIISRVTYDRKNEYFLQELYIDKIEKKKIKIIFTQLAESLNKNYFNKNYRDKEVLDSNDWDRILSSGSSSSHLLQPIEAVVQLLKPGIKNELEFSDFKLFNPFIRSILIGWYGYSLKIPKKLMESLIVEGKEISFLAAFIMHDIGYDRKKSPTWLKQSFISTCIEKWETIGKYMFIRTYGINYRISKNHSKTYKRLEKLIRPIVYDKLKIKNDENSKWIKTLDFPDCYIALTYWLIEQKIQYSDSSLTNRDELVDQIISQLSKIAADIPITLTLDNSPDPFKTFQLYNTKYQVTIAHLLVLIIYLSAENEKSLTNACYSFKPLFYGGFQAKRQATIFTEIILLILLSGNNFTAEKKHFEKIRKLLQMVSNSLLIPYIHLTEREEEIWFPDSEMVTTYNPGKFLINYSIKKVKISAVYPYYKNFLDLFESIKISEWPYERDI